MNLSELISLGYTCVNGTLTPPVVPVIGDCIGGVVIPDDWQPDPCDPCTTTEINLLATPIPIATLDYVGCAGIEGFRQLTFTRNILANPQLTVKYNGVPIASGFALGNGGTVLFNIEQHLTSVGSTSGTYTITHSGTYLGYPVSVTYELIIGSNGVGTDLLCDQVQDTYALISYSNSTLQQYTATLTNPAAATNGVIWFWETSNSMPILSGQGTDSIVYAGNGTVSVQAVLPGCGTVTQVQNNTICLNCDDIISTLDLSGDIPPFLVQYFGSNDGIIYDFVCSVSPSSIGFSVENIDALCDKCINDTTGEYSIVRVVIYDEDGNVINSINQELPVCTVTTSLLNTNAGEVLQIVLGSSMPNAVFKNCDDIDNSIGIKFTAVAGDSPVYNIPYFPFGGTPDVSNIPAAYQATSITNGILIPSANIISEGYEGFVLLAQISIETEDCGCLQGQKDRVEFVLSSPPPPPTEPPPSPTCPEGMTGTYPNCVPIVDESHYGGTAGTGFFSSPGGASTNLAIRYKATFTLKGNQTCLPYSQHFVFRRTNALGTDGTIVWQGNLILNPGGNVTTSTPMPTGMTLFQSNLLTNQPGTGNNLGQLYTQKKVDIVFNFITLGILNGEHIRVIRDGYMACGNYYTTLGFNGYPCYTIATNGNNPNNGSCYFAIWNINL